MSDVYEVRVTMRAWVEWPDGAPTQKLLRERLLPAMDQQFRDYVHGVDNTGVIRSTSGVVGIAEVGP